jgi:hypothetical protein
VEHLRIAAVQYQRSVKSWHGPLMFHRRALGAVFILATLRFSRLGRLVVFLPELFDDFFLVADEI